MKEELLIYHLTKKQRKLKLKKIEIKIKKSQDLEIEIRRSAMPGVPIYVSLEDGIFAISWRFEEAVARGLWHPRRNDIDARPEGDAKSGRPSSREAAE